MPIVCPLRPFRASVEIVCMKEECAWWIFDRMGEGQCAVKIIAYGAIAGNSWSD